MILFGFCFVFVLVVILNSNRNSIFLKIVDCPPIKTVELRSDLFKNCWLFVNQNCGTLFRFIYWLLFVHQSKLWYFVPIYLNKSKTIIHVCEVQTLLFDCYFGTLLPLNCFFSYSIEHFIHFKEIVSINQICWFLCRSNRYNRSVLGRWFLLRRNHLVTVVIFRQFSIIFSNIESFYIEVVFYSRIVASVVFL